MKLSNPHHHLNITVDGKTYPVRHVARTYEEANQFIANTNHELGVIDTDDQGNIYIADIAPNNS